jgi:hypothetical protein
MKIKKIKIKTLHYIMSNYGLPISASTYNGNNSMQHQEYLTRRSEDRRRLWSNGFEGSYFSNNMRQIHSYPVNNNGMPICYIYNRAEREAFLRELKRKEQQANFDRCCRVNDEITRNIRNRPQIQYIPIVHEKTKFQKVKEFIGNLFNALCCSSHIRA